VCFFPPLYRPDRGTGIVFSCFGHVVNIANVAVMGRVTQIAAIENTTAIWEYDPSLPGNWILGGSLDVIAAIRTIAVKVSLPFFTNMKFSYVVALRFKHLGNGSNTSRNSSCSANSPSPLGFHSTATFDGAQHMACLSVHTSCIK
jgi:hypothetical protein